MSQGKILIIDDEADLLETMSYRLRASGYEVITACDGPSGLDKVKSETFDLIILDVMMPGMDGFETIKRLKKETSAQKIPVIISSCGREEEEWAKKSINLGASGYVVKPFEGDSLVFTVNEFMKHK